MVRILLVVPFDGHRQATPSLGVGYLRAYAARHSSNEVVLHDENFLADRDAALRTRIAEIRPDMVGITFPSSAVFRVVELAALVGEYFPELPVFAGGYHPTAEPELTLRLVPGLDFVVRGEGELFAARLGVDWRAAPNVAWLDDGRYRENPVETVADLDDIPFPDRGWYDSRYFRPQTGVISGIFGRTATLLSSRGCPYACRFCSGKAMRKMVRHHGTGRVMEEIEHILGALDTPDYLYFVDVQFLARWDRVEELCRELIRAGHHRRFRWAATVSADAMTAGRAALLKEAGCFYLSFGFESNSARVLRIINKRATPEDNLRACEICERQGIFINSAFLFGIPGEEEEDLQATVDFVRERKIGFTGVNIMKPLPGSPFYEDFVRSGLIRPSLAEWRRVSSIHEAGPICNDRVSPERYRHYIGLFNRAARRQALLQGFRANWRLRLKYRLSGGGKGEQ